MSFSVNQLKDYLKTKNKDEVVIVETKQEPEVVEYQLKEDYETEEYKEEDATTEAQFLVTEDVKSTVEGTVSTQEKKDELPVIDVKESTENDKEQVKSFSERRFNNSGNLNSLLLKAINSPTVTKKPMDKMYENFQFVGFFSSTYFDSIGFLPQNGIMPYEIELNLEGGTYFDAFHSFLYVKSGVEAKSILMDEINNTTNVEQVLKKAMFMAETQIASTSNVQKLERVIENQLMVVANRLVSYKTNNLEKPILLSEIYTLYHYITQLKSIDFGSEIIKLSKNNQIMFLLELIKTIKVSDESTNDITDINYLLQNLNVSVSDKSDNIDRESFEERFPVLYFVSASSDPLPSDVNPVGYLVVKSDLEKQKLMMKLKGYKADLNSLIKTLDYDFIGLLNEFNTTKPEIPKTLFDVLSKELSIYKKTLAFYIPLSQLEYLVENNDTDILSTLKSMENDEPYYIQPDLGVDYENFALPNFFSVYPENHLPKSILPFFSSERTSIPESIFLNEEYYPKMFELLGKLDKLEDSVVCYLCHLVSIISLTKPMSGYTPTPTWKKLYFEIYTRINFIVEKLQTMDLKNLFDGYRKSVSEYINRVLDQNNVGDNKNVFYESREALKSLLSVGEPSTNVSSTETFAKLLILEFITASKLMQFDWAGFSIDKIINNVFSRSKSEGFAQVIFRKSGFSTLSVVPPFENNKTYIGNFSTLQFGREIKGLGLPKGYNDAKVKEWIVKNKLRIELKSIDPLTVEDSHMVKVKNINKISEIKKADKKEEGNLIYFVENDGATNTSLASGYPVHWVVKNFGIKDEKGNIIDNTNVSTGFIDVSDATKKAEIKKAIQDTTSKSVCFWILKGKVPSNYVEAVVKSMEEQMPTATFTIAKCFEDIPKFSNVIAFLDTTKEEFDKENQYLVKSRPDIYFEYFEFKMVPSVSKNMDDPHRNVIYADKSNFKAFITLFYYKYVGLVRFKYRTEDNTTKDFPSTQSLISEIKDSGEF